MKKKISVIAVAVVMIVLGRMYAATPADASQLVLMTEPNPVIHFLELVPVRVKFLDRSGLPISEASVVFLPQSDTADTNLSNSNPIITDAEGMAETFIEAGNVEVDFDLLIGVRSGDDIVPPITVLVRVIPPGVGVPEANWPSEEFRSIQDAIYALADGGTLRMAEGVYEVAQPIFIRNKMVNIVGGGANCKDLLPDTEQFNKKSERNASLGTVLVGPHVEGRVPPNESIGHLNFYNGGGSVTDIWFKGAKASIVGRDIDGSGKPLDVSDVCATDTVRGIHWKASAPITVTDTIIADVVWNGISISLENFLNVVEHFISDTYIINPDGACVYFENALAGVMDDYLINCLNGGVVSANSVIAVADTNFINNYKTAILLGSSFGFLVDNIIIDTRPVIFTNNLGDGVIAWDNSTVVMANNYIVNSHRAAVSSFGSTVEMDSNHLICQSFDLNGEPYNGPFDFIDLGGNLCGCPSAVNTCSVVSASLEPPPPQGGLE